MASAIWLATRDLRVHDNPALGAAVEAAAAGVAGVAGAGAGAAPAGAEAGGAPAPQVVPLFVIDPAIPRPANRAAFLAGALADLDASLRERGAALVVRHGDPAEEAVRCAVATGARAICVASDVTLHARAREARLARLCEEARIELRLAAGSTVQPPGAIVPDGGDPPRGAYQVFTPYWRRWAATPLRGHVETPSRLALPEGLRPDAVPPAAGLIGRGIPASQLPAGGETAGCERARAWLAGPVDRYAEMRDDLAADATSRLSPYLHLGCISAVALVRRLEGRAEAHEFVRQLCWRDFYAQLLADRPAIAREDFRPRGGGWLDDPAGLEAWQAGKTGYPVVDAGMRQLLAEGFVHNRARMVVASFLTKHLGIDWRLGARWFAEHLVDGDVASNSGNWQWVAGTGADTQPHRVFNPTLQGQRYDPAGDYVRHWVTELAGVRGSAVHEPWRIPAAERALLRYPPPIVDHAEAVAAYRARARVAP